MKRLLLLLCGGTFLAHSVQAQCSFTINVSTQPAYCFGSSTGAATAGVVGGTGPFSIHWLAPINQTGSSVTGLAAGTYQVAVIDSSIMCDDTVSFTITQPMQLQSAVSATNVTCNGMCDGSIITTVFGGTAPYIFSWNTGQTTSMLNNICAGVYFFTATDANGCTTQQAVTVAQPAPVTVNATAGTATCGVCDGSITIAATGGTGGFNYSIDGGAVYYISPSFNSICAGGYSIVVVDANGCTGNTNVIVPTTSGFSVGFDTIQAPSCGTCNGVVVAMPLGGVAPYSYTWNGVGSSIDSLATGLCSYNTATVNITDGAGCVVGAIYTPVSNPIPGMTVTSVITPESFAGANDAVINITITGGPSILSFLWSNGATSADIYSVSNGAYSLYVSDTSGNCNTYNFTIGISPVIYGVISGKIYHDDNMNCIYDGADMGLNVGTVTAMPAGYSGYASYNGQYYMWVPAGSYTITHNPGMGAAASPGCTTSYPVVINAGNTVVNNIDFADTVTNSADAYTYVYCNGIVPGFNGNYVIYLQNYLPFAANGTLMFVLPDTLTFVSASVTPSAVSGDTIWFNFTGLTWALPQYFTITFSTPANPGLLGTSLTGCAYVDVTNVTDINLANNTTCYSRMVTGSFDPNDKSVSPTGEDVTGDIELTEDTFTYLIRFQNTGNGPAVNIHVDDTISNLLDMSTFEMLGASHNYSIITKPGNVIVWQFDNINLPDSGSNEPASHGWIQFKIKAKPTVGIGDVINNTADIYFDFNPPVITNTTVNTYVLPDYIPEIEKENVLNVYPNPVNDVLTIIHPEKGKGAMKISIMDVSGRTMQQLTLMGTQMSVDVKNLAPGMYVIQASNNHVNYTTRFVRR